MDNFTSLAHHDISTTTLVLSGLALTFLYLCFTHSGHALGTSSRPDLETPPGIPLLGNLLEIQANRSQLVECEFACLHLENGWRAEECVLCEPRIDDVFCTTVWMLSKQKQQTKKALSWTVPGLFRGLRLVEASKPEVSSAELEMRWALACCS
jgi:hypothetical protein